MKRCPIVADQLPSSLPKVEEGKMKRIIIIDGETTVIEFDDESTETNYD